MTIGTRVRDWITTTEGTVIETMPDAVRIEWDNARGQETFWYTLNYLTAVEGANPMIEVLAD